MKKKLSKILIIEDDQFIRRICKNGLERSGFDVVTATEGEEGIEKAREQSPDLILSDLIMPHKNGFEMLEQIKKDEQLKDIPIIILSNLGQESDIQKIKKMGVVDYLIKSDFKIKEVVERINYHLNKLEKQK